MTEHAQPSKPEQDHKGRFVKGNVGGPGRLRGLPAKGDIVSWARVFFASERYRKSLEQRILRGRANHMEIYLAQMLAGKPRETLRLENPEGEAVQFVQVYLPEKAPIQVRDVVDGEVVKPEAAAEAKAQAIVRVLLPENGTGSNGSNGHGPNGSGSNGHG